MDKVFISTECVICMGDDVIPTQVFKPCSHCCVCADCCAKITSSSLPCPMCRAEIVGIEECDSSQCAVGAIPEEVVQEFVKEHRSSYMSRFKIAKNAMWIGNSKQARAIASHVFSELEERERETKGGERCMGKKRTMELDEDEGVLHVSYKIGRKLYKEDHPYDPNAQSNLDDPLQVAIEDPALYWNSCYNAKKLKQTL